MKTLLMLSRRTKESEVLRILLIIFPILLPINVVDSALVEFPKNTAVTNATKRTEFRCKTNLGDELKWFFQPNDTAQRQQLFCGQYKMSEQTKSYCNIQNEEPGKFYLILTIQDESAQTYTCHELNTDQEKSAELIIIEPVKFEKDANKSHVILDCSVNFRGNWAPELEWSHNGTSVVKGIDVSVAPNHNVSSFLIIPRNDSAMAGIYNCTVRFNLRGKPKQTTDNSVPSYMDTSNLTVHPDIPSDGNSKGSSSNIGLIIVCVVAAVVVAGGGGGGGGVAAGITRKKLPEKINSFSSTEESCSTVIETTIYPTKGVRPLYIYI